MCGHYICIGTGRGKCVHIVFLKRFFQCDRVEGFHCLSWVWFWFFILLIVLGFFPYPEFWNMTNSSC